jgi:RNA polymerase sigma-70 factor (ECF subfamily)
VGGSVLAVNPPRVDVEMRGFAASVAEDPRLVQSLREGDERVFVEIVREHAASMLYVASLFVRDRAVAEEVVQETWLGVLRGIDRFEGRSSFKTWLFSILTNTAKSRAQREGRSLPFSAIAATDLADDEPVVDPDRFLPEGDRWAHHWASLPQRFDSLPEEQLLSAETVAVAQSAITALPESQRAVVTLRDVAGFSSEDVRRELGLSEGNQRVLLHRGRNKVRRALERHFAQAELR